MGEINEFLRIKKEIEETFDNATDAEIKFLLEGDSDDVPLKKKLFFQKKQLELIALGNHDELMDIILTAVIAKEMGRERGHQMEKIFTWEEIETPLIDIHDDPIVLYKKQERDGIILTDDGWVLSAINAGTSFFDEPDKKRAMESILERFNVLNIEDKLTVYATNENFALKERQLIFAISEIQGLVLEYMFVYGIKL